MFRLKAENCLSILEIVKKELKISIVNLIYSLFGYNLIISPGRFFIYDLLYTSFFWFITEYIFEIRYNRKLSQKRNMHWELFE